MQKKYKGQLVYISFNHNPNHMLNNYYKFVRQVMFLIDPVRNAFNRY
jgi:hypothetical protein